MSVNTSTTISTAPPMPSSAVPLSPARKQAKGKGRDLLGMRGVTATGSGPKDGPPPRADDAARRAVAEWHVVRGEVALAYAAACSRAHESGKPNGGLPMTGKRLDNLLSRLERTEAKLMQATPRSLAEISEYVEIAEEILTEKRVDPNGPLGSGPALEILPQVRNAVLSLEEGDI